MSNDEFILVEKPAIEQLKQLNWQYIDGTKLSPDLTEERKSFKHVILKSNLIKAIKRINPWINEDNIKKLDCTLLVTDHDSFDYQLIKENSKLIIDTRGKYMPSKKIIRA